MGDLRHERCGDCLEEECDADIETSEVCTKTEAQGQDAGEEGDNGEERGDNVESKHESAQVEELVGANELFRDVVLGAEVARRVERQGSLSVAAERVLASISAAECEESPAGRVAELPAARDAIGGGLKEVGVSYWARVDSSGEDDEEL